MNSAAELELLRVARRRVAHAHAADGVVAEDLLDHGAVADADLRVREHGLAVGGLGGQRVAALQDDDLADGLGQRERLLERRVAAAHDADRAVAHERRVAARAVADAAALQALLALDAEGPQARAGGEDHGPRLRPRRRSSPGATPSPARLEALELGHADLGAVVGRLLLEHRAQLVAGDALREAGHAVDPLDAEQQPAGRASAQHERRAAHAGRVDRGGEGGDAATGDGYVVARQPPRLRAYPRVSGFRTSCCRSPRSRAPAG